MDGNFDAREVFVEVMRWSVALNAIEDMRWKVVAMSYNVTQFIEQRRTIF